VRDASKPSNRRLGRAYQGALEAVLAVVVGAGAGAWADSRFGTSPLLLLVGLVLGFATFVLRITRLLRELSPPPEGGD
jgi:F0F1-type ATP synthase assembly protein I